MTSQSLVCQLNSKQSHAKYPFVLLLQLSPQEYFDQLLEDRGYNVPLIESINSAYFNDPTELQIASYGRKMQVAVRKGDVTALEKLLKCGLSPNACNRFGESILFLACRRGKTEILQALIEARAAIQICDDHGRNLLHASCWAINPPFEIVKILLEYDSSMLFMMDTRGLTPLSYINIEDWGKWNDWLHENIDTFFPIDKAATYRESAVATMCPNMVPLPKKSPLIELEMIEMLANGRVSADEVLGMIEEKCIAGMVASSESDDGGYFDGDSSTEFGSDEESSIFGPMEDKIFD